MYAPANARSLYNSRSQYKYVERKDNGYRARIRIKGKLRTIAKANTERECVTRTIAWLESVYGPRWPLVLRWFYHKQWRPEVEISWSESGGCFTLIAWVFGERTTLLPDAAFPQKTVRRIGFATASQARTYLNWWLKTKHGPRADFVLWRTDVPEPVVEIEDDWAASFGEPSGEVSRFAARFASSR